MSDFHECVGIGFSMPLFQYTSAADVPYHCDQHNRKWEICQDYAAYDVLATKGMEVAV